MKKLLSVFGLIAFAVSVQAQSNLEVSLLQKETLDPVVGISVQVENIDIGFSKTAVSNDQGKVFFAALSTSGEYTITVLENNETTEIITKGILLRSNKTRSITILVGEKSDTELDEVTVQGSRAVASINSVNAEVSSELEQQEIENIPIEGRDITRSLFRLPNVTPSTGFYPEAPRVSINGANSLFTSYLIDGMDNNERFLGGPRFRVPIGITKNVTVLTNNYSAEYGQTSNGIFDITTKSGSNTLTGEAYYEVRPGLVIDASSPFTQTDLSGNAVKDGFQRHQFGFGLGGALKEDKTFYYVNAEQTTSIKDNLLTSAPLGVNETVQGNNNYTLLSAKIDHNWSDNFKSALRIHKGFVSIDRQGGGLAGGNTFPEAGNNQTRDSFTAALNNTYFGNGFTSETNYQYAEMDWLYLNPNTTGVPSVFVEDPSGQTIAVLGETLGNFDLVQKTHQLQQKFTIPKGNHIIKAGVGILSSIHNDTRGGNGNGFYTVRLNQTQLDNLNNQNLGTGLSYTDIPSDVAVQSYSVELRPNTFDGSQTIYSLYAEDLYSVNSRLNLTFGLRYDYDNLSKGGADQGDFNNLSPRFNFNYKLDNRTSLRGGYGLFYEKIVYAIYSDAVAGSSRSPDFQRQLQLLIDAGQLPSDTDINQITRNGNASVSPQGVTYLNGPTASDFDDSDGFGFSNEFKILNPNGYDNPYSHQISLGVQRQIADDMLFYVDLMHTRGFNQFRLTDVNAPSSFEVTNPNGGAGDVRSQVDADETRDVPILYDNSGAPYALDGTDTLRNISRRVTMTETAGESRYYAANVNLLKNRDADDYSFRISYTLSSLRNNTEDINFEAEDANDFDDEWGPSINDRRHVFSIFGTYYAFDDLGITLASLIQSGQPVNRVPDATQFGTTDLNGDGGSFATQYTGKTDRQPGASRNDGRLPWSYTFDLSLKYDFSVGNGKLRARADIFNLLNTTNYSGYTSNATASNQIQVGLIDRNNYTYRNSAPPRQFQFSLSYRF